MNNNPIAEQNKDITIAILPFELLDGNHNLSPIIRGFSEDLSIAFSKFTGLAVVSHHSTRHIEDISDREAIRDLNAEYLITGSFRIRDEKIRIGIHLLRTPDFIVVFSDQHDIPVDAILDTQDKIVQQIVSVLQQQVDQDLLSYSFSKETVSLRAYENWLVGKELLRKGTLESDLEARHHFSEALKIDPSFARAYTGISLSYFNEWSCQLWDRWDVSQKGAQEYALKALQVDPKDYISLAVLGRTYLFSEEYNKAEHYLRKSLLMNPNDADNLILIAFSMMFLGYAEEAARLYRRACDLNPLHPNHYYAYGSNIYFEMGCYEESLELAKKVNVDTVWIDFPLYLAAACYYLDRPEEMHRHWAHYIRRFEQFINGGESATGEAALAWHIKVNPYRGQTHMERFRNYLENAGITEQEPGAAVTIASPSAHLVRQGELWEFGFESERILLKEAKGFYDLTRLLREPEREWHCTELMEATLIADTGAEAADGKALSAYRARVRELRSEIEDAEAMNDPGTAARLQREYEQLLEHLSRSVNLQGRSRRIGGAVEKARSAVTWRIRSAIRKIDEQHPSLGRHLTNSIKTGNFCSYRPERPVQWVISDE